MQKWLKNRSIVFVVDGAYAAFKLLNLQTEQITFVTRLPITAALYKLPPKRKKHAPGKEPVLLASTDTTMSPHRIISLYVQRWNLEVTYHEARAHLGIETQRQWLKPSITRTTPTLPS